MGNCIGKKSGVRTKHHQRPPSSLVTNQLVINSTLPSENTSSFNNVIKVVQYPSSVTPTTNDQFLFGCTSSPTISPVQLSIEFSESPITLITNEEDTTMGYLFSKEKPIEIDQQVHPNVIDEKSLDTSLTPSLSVSSLSSLNSSTTPFSSDDQLILSSSSSADTNPLRSISPSEQIERGLFSTILPVSSSRNTSDLFLTEFHQNVVSHNYQTLQSVIDDVVQQQFLRIHRRTQTTFLEHQQFQCQHLKNIHKFDTPSLIFDEKHSLVYLTKYPHWNGSLHTLASTIRNPSSVCSSCDHCSSVLSGWKLHDRLRTFLLVNTTYQLVQRCFKESNRLFGHVSRLDDHRIRQTMIDTSKLNYSCDLDVDHTNIYFVIHVQSWPDDIRSTYERRQRQWPVNIANLFSNTCFIRYRSNDDRELLTSERCSSCEKVFSSISNSSWSYTYAAIEAQLILTMSNGQKRFSSIVWNYLQCKSHGRLPFLIFKHTLFYFFEQYSSDDFATSDMLSYLHLFVEFLLHRFQLQSIPHYFNSTCNLYRDQIVLDFLSVKATHFDLKTDSISRLPKASMYLHRLIYLIEFQSQFFPCLRSSKTNPMQMILDTHELVMKQLTIGVKTYNKRRLDLTRAVKLHRPLTLDCLCKYQEDNVQVILDYLPLLREREPSLLIHSFWSISIQYLNSLFADLFQVKSSSSISESSSSS